MVPRIRLQNRGTAAGLALRNVWLIFCSPAAMWNSLESWISAGLPVSRIRQSAASNTVLNKWLLFSKALSTVRAAVCA